MLHGIDISNWQKGFKIPESLDFCIVKATEGFRYVDPYCDGFIQQAISKGILFGFYHFARNNKPETEAIHFRNNTKGYELLGIPVLDIEDETIDDWGSWCQRFVDKYHAMTSVYPMIYASASTLPRFASYPLVGTCGLWIAGYPDNREHEMKDVPNFPYSVSPWPFAAVWQYTANGCLPNWDEPLDLDVAYMDADAWKKYANPCGNADTTIQLPPISQSPDKSGRTFHFSNSLLDVDVTIKGDV